MRKTTIDYVDCTPAQRKEFDQTLKDMPKWNNSLRGVPRDMMTMVMTPQPYIILTKNKTDEIDKLVLEFRHLLKLLGITQKAARANDYSLNIDTRDKLVDYAFKKGGEAWIAYKKFPW